jgi:acyl-CoA thioester hydrolase
VTATSGHIEAGSHFFPLRVYYEDTDAGGIVYYANYLKFAERARTEMLRLVGLNQSQLKKENGILFAVRNLTIDYHRPAVLDDLLEVVSRFKTLAGASLEVSQVLRRKSEELIRLELRIVCVRLDGRPTRIPSFVAQALQPYFSGSDEE